MSQRLMRTVWRAYPRSGSRRDVLMALADRATEQGAVVMSVKDLQAATRLSRCTVMRSIRALQSAQWVAVSRGAGKGAKKAYLIDVRRLLEQEGYQW